MLLPSFVKCGIHFLGERTKVLGLNNSIFLNRFPLPIIGNRAGIVNSQRIERSDAVIRVYDDAGSVIERTSTRAISKNR
jgi:hypothetical protein